jgi:putative Holliday junction resolvase
MLTAHTSVLGLDVGDKRVGVAVATLAARLPRPLITLERNDRFFEALKEIMRNEDVGTLVIGLPRNLRGTDTAQTRSVEAFVEQLKKHTGVPVHLQDEAVTSKQAEEELEARGKPYTRSDIDALAATYILQDWLSDHSSEQGVA